MDTTTPPLPTPEDAKWPMKAILFVGYFGNKTPEGRRFFYRSMGALALMLVLEFASFPATFALAGYFAMDDVRLAKIIGHVLAGITFSFISWAFWKYINELDELARTMQLQAVCLTYLTGLSLMAFVSILGLAEDWHIDPFIAFIMLEPVRGFWLWKLARRYQ